MYWDDPIAPLPKLGPPYVAPDGIVVELESDEGNEVRGEYRPFTLAIEHGMQEGGTSIDTAIAEPFFRCSQSMEIVGIELNANTTVGT